MFYGNETGQTQSLHPLSFHLYYIVEKAKLYGHRRNQRFPWATGEELTTNVEFRGIFGRGQGHGTVSHLDCGGG